VYMSRIRKLLKADPNVKIENIHGLGFTLIHP
jgi:DNA-binding response OmpR family regulator